LLTYYRNTGDTAFAQQILPWLEGQLAYDATLTDSDGLVVTGPQISTTNGGYDWDFYDGAKTGTVTAFNDLYYVDRPGRAGEDRREQGLGQGVAGEDVQAAVAGLVTSGDRWPGRLWSIRRRSAGGRR
jgi:hypothetical protein